MAVGAGGAFTPGLKELPPVGPMRFSVGVTSGVVDGVVVVLDGLSVSPPPQAVNAAIDTMAATPRTPAVRRVCILSMSVHPILVVRSEDKSFRLGHDGALRTRRAVISQCGLCQGHPLEPVVPSPED